MTSSIIDLIKPRSRDLGDFSVRRLLPFATTRKIGPWVFFDHMGPVEFPPGKGIDVRPHPHINLATVTYLFEGEIKHRDSLGFEQAIRPGDINLMIAGKGIVHSERSSTESRAKPQKLHGLQLWLGLPEVDEETDPEFLHYSASDLPTTHIGGVPVRVMIGKAYGLESPVKQMARTLYIEADLKEGDRIELPDESERGIYVAHGEIEAGSQNVAEYELAVLKAGKVEIQARKPSRIALIGGESLGERHIYWNFVSSRKERIQQAKQDWKEGRFPKVPGDEEEFIPLPD